MPIWMQSSKEYQGEIRKPKWSMQRNRGQHRMGKARDLFKKIRDTKGKFHEKMGIIKYRSVMDLTEAEDIKKRWQECTEEPYKKKIYSWSG